MLLSQRIKLVWHFQLVRLEYTSNCVLDQRDIEFFGTVMSFEDIYYKSLQNSAMQNGFNFNCLFSTDL